MQTRYGFTCGAFDLLHPGHLEMLAYCRRKCDKLIVGLQTDPSIDRSTKSKPVQSTLERFIQLQAIGTVDEIIPYDTENDLHNLLCVLHGRYGDDLIRFLGQDYNHHGAMYTGVELPIHVEFNPRTHNFSSSGLRKKIVQDNEPKDTPAER